MNVIHRPVTLLVSSTDCCFPSAGPRHVAIIPLRAAQPQPLDVNQKTLVLCPCNKTYDKGIFKPFFTGHNPYCVAETASLRTGDLSLEDIDLHIYVLDFTN